MTLNIDESRMKRELIIIYKNFLKNPEDSSIHQLAIVYDRHYGGISSYNDIMSKLVISKELEQAINGLSAIYQYGLHNSEHEAFSNEKIIKIAKEILQKLKSLKK